MNDAQFIRWMLGVIVAVFIGSIPVGVATVKMVWNQARSQATASEERRVLAVAVEKLTAIVDSHDKSIINLEKEDEIRRRLESILASRGLNQ